MHRGTRHGKVTPLARCVILPVVRCAPMEKGKATASYISALCIYGTIGWVLAYVDLPSEVVVLCRGVLGTAFILLFILVTKRGFDTAATRANLGWLALSGVCLGLNWVFLFAAYRATTVAVASLCNYMAPVIVIIMAPLILGEKRSAKKAACAAVAVLGMVLVSGVLAGGAQGVAAEGIGLGLAAAAGFAVMVVCNKKMGPVPVFEKAALQLAFATLAALPFVIAGNWGQELSPDAVSVGLVVLLGLLHTGVAYCLYFGALGVLSAQSIAVLGYIEPAVSVLVSAFILGEPLSVAGWVGAALIIGAAAVSELVE